MQILDKYLHDLDHHKGIGILSLLYLGLNVMNVRKEHLLIRLKLLRES